MEVIGYIIFGILCAIALILIIGIGSILKVLEKIETDIVGTEALLCMLNRVRPSELRQMFEKREMSDEKNSD